MDSLRFPNQSDLSFLEVVSNSRCECLIPTRLMLSGALTCRCFGNYLRRKLGAGPEICMQIIISSSRSRPSPLRALTLNYVEFNVNMGHDIVEGIGDETKL